MGGGRPVPLCYPRRRGRGPALACSGPECGCSVVMTMVWRCHLSSSECRCYRLDGFSLFKRLPIPLSSGARPLEQSVGEWLEAVGLQQYESRLLLNGFDDVRFLVSAQPWGRPLPHPRPRWRWKLYVDLCPRKRGPRG